MVSEKSILKFLNEPVYALSSATCFHSFLEFQNQEINDEKTITFLSSLIKKAFEPSGLSQPSTAILIPAVEYPN